MDTETPRGTTRKTGRGFGTGSAGETRFSTACPLDCPDSCSLEVTVENGRVVGLEGNWRNPLTQGFLCSKVRRFPAHLYSSYRIQSPAARVGSKGLGEFRSIGWNEALDILTRKIQRAVETYGGESILPLSYGGSNGLVSHQSMDHLFFTRLGASRLRRSVCAAPSRAAASAMYGKMQGVSLTDYQHAKLIVIWGSNPSVSGIHLVPLIRKARQKGARLVVVDPRRTQLAKQADLHLAVRPGTDVAVALSLIRWFFEEDRADLEFLSRHATGVEKLRQRARHWTFERAAETSGVPASTLRKFAELYAEVSPAVIRCGWGIERNRNGGSAVASVLALPAVAGKFGERAGGYTLSNSGVWTLAEPVQDDRVPPREVNMNRLGRALESAEPPVEVLFVYSCNPVATLPDQGRVRRGLEREDLFTVVFDQVMTDSARYADLLLPATSFLEHVDLARGYGAAVLHPVVPVCRPVGEARSNFEVFKALSRRFGFSLPESFDSEPRFVKDLLTEESGAEERLQSEGFAFPRNGFSPIQFLHVFPRTAGSKVHLFPPELDEAAARGLYAYQGDPATSQYPLALISPATSRTTNSTFGQLDRALVPVRIHPLDAQNRGVVEGDRIVIFNDLGTVSCHARLTEDVAPGTVVLPKGLWSHNTLNGSTANCLVPDSLTDLGAGACFNDARVQIELDIGT